MQSSTVNMIRKTLSVISNAWSTDLFSVTKSKVAIPITVEGQVNSVHVDSGEHLQIDTHSVH